MHAERRRRRNERERAERALRELDARIASLNLERTDLHATIERLASDASNVDVYARLADVDKELAAAESAWLEWTDRMEALGALDEASAALGLARAQTSAAQTAPILLDAQRDLYKLMAEVAATPENAERFRAIDAARVTWLEEQTDAISHIVGMPREFILPGDTPGGASLSMARAIIRRAERRVVALFDTGEITNPDLQRYLNRLSSLCFVLELLENQSAGKSTSLAKGSS